MRITDELRTSGIYRFPSNMRVFTEEELTAIADRIDEQHESEVSVAERNGYVEAMDKVDSEYIKLPKDTDGVPWRIGDVTENGQTINAMGLNKYGWYFLGTVNDIEPSIHRHHHAPTVEDVLRECIANVCRSNAELHEQGCPPLTMEDIDEELDEYINEYAAKLRLAGEAE